MSAAMNQDAEAAAKARNAAIGDLDDRIAELVAIADGASGLVDTIVRNMEGAEKTWPGISFGPWRGLDWVMFELQQRIKAAQDAARAIP